MAQTRSGLDDLPVPGGAAGSVGRSPGTAGSTPSPRARPPAYSGTIPLPRPPRRALVGGQPGMGPVAWERSPGRTSGRASAVRVRFAAEARPCYIVRQRPGQRRRRRAGLASAGSASILMRANQPSCLRLAFEATCPRLRLVLPAVRGRGGAVPARDHPAAARPVRLRDRHLPAAAVLPAWSRHRASPSSASASAPRWTSSSTWPRRRCGRCGWAGSTSLHAVMVSGGAFSRPRYLKARRLRRCSRSRTATARSTSGATWDRSSPTYAPLHRRFDRVHAISSFLAERAVRYGVPPAAITVVPNGCDPHLFDEPPSEAAQAALRRDLGLDGARVVVSVSRLVLKNGLDRLLRPSPVLPEVPDAALLLVGEGEDRAALERLAGSLGIAAACALRERSPTTTCALPAPGRGLRAAVAERRTGHRVPRGDGVRPARRRHADRRDPGVPVDGRTGLFCDPERPETIAEAVVRLMRDRTLAARWRGPAARSCRALPLGGGCGEDRRDLRRPSPAIRGRAGRRGSRAAGTPRRGRPPARPPPRLRRLPTTTRTPAAKRDGRDRCPRRLGAQHPAARQRGHPRLRVAGGEYHVAPRVRAAPTPPAPASRPAPAPARR